jgi:hypothetical protein
MIETIPASKIQPYSVVLDLDRTLFDTEGFMDDTAETLETYFHIDAQKFTRDIPNYYVQTSGNLRAYDMFAHLTHLALNSDSVEDCLLSTLPSTARGANGYLYPDSPKFINFLRNTPDVEDLTLLTHGYLRPQEIKIALARAVLDDLHSIVVTEEPKDIYLRTNFQDKQGIIVDDKDIENLSSNFVHAPIDRTGTSKHGYNSLVMIQRSWSHFVRQLVLAS